MATITSVASGNWGTAGTWDTGSVPANGDAVIIAEGHEVLFDVDQSGFANGLASLTINGILHFNWGTSSETALKMNGNIIGTGCLYLGKLIDVSTYYVYTKWNLVNGREHTYVLTGLPNKRTMAFGETKLNMDYLKKDSLDEVDETPGSFYVDPSTGFNYIHVKNSNDPNDTDLYFIFGISRPNVGTESRCQLIFNATGTINVPVIRMYGWHPEREFTQLESDVDKDATEIVLNDDLGLQSGDKICIGSGTENTAPITENNGGIYTVQSYDAPTKTVIITEGLQTSRKEGDVVSWSSRPIVIYRTSGTNPLITTILNNIRFSGVKFMTKPCSVSYNVGYPQGWTFESCTLEQYSSGIHNVIYKNTIGYGATNYFLQVNGNNIIYDMCVGINLGNDTIIGGNNIKVISCVFQNIWTLYSAATTNLLFKECKIKNAWIIPGNGGHANFIDCELSGADNERCYKSYIVAKDCVFKDNETGYLRSAKGKIYNCFFEGDNEVSAYKEWYHPINEVLESFNHNKVIGNYKAWMKGGTIETDTDLSGDPIQGHLIFNCESADYPVFRDFPMLLAAYKTNRWQALVNKSFTGGEVKIELIDPTSDPLIDSEATPMASYTLPDQADTNLPLKLGYKSDKAMQAILRISATNSTGAVEVDTSLIENRINHGS